MKTSYFSASEHDFENIISINNSDADNDEMDYDLDYDVNEMYYALNAENN
jgi:hypothetical protein